jgi:hypothetical protein
MATKTTEPEPEGRPAIPALGDEFKGLLDDVARDVIVYVPEQVGDTIAGLVVATEGITTEFGPRPATILDVNPADPSLPLVRFVWIDTVLQTAFERHTLRRGDQVAVRLTKRSGQTGVGDYNDWRVVVVKGDPSAPPAPPAPAPSEQPF